MMRPPFLLLSVVLLGSAVRVGAECMAGETVDMVSGKPCPKTEPADGAIKGGAGTPVNKNNTGAYIKLKTGQSTNVSENVSAGGSIAAGTQFGNGVIAAPETVGNIGAVNSGVKKDPAVMSMPMPDPNAKPYNTADAKARANVEFDELRNKYRDDPFRLAVIERTRTIFLARLDSHPGGQFARGEVDKLDEMVQTQMDYGRAIWGTLEGSNLPMDQRKAIMRGLINGGPDAIANMPGMTPALLNQLRQQAAQAGDQMGHYHGSNGPQSVMGDLHNAMFDAYDQVKREKPNGGQDYVPTLPGNHGDYMKKNVGNDPASWEIAGREALARGDKPGGMRALANAIGLGAGADALTLHAELLKESGDYAGAAAEARKALELRPGDKDALMVLHESEGRGGATGGSAGSQRAASSGGSSGYGAGEAGYANGGWQSGTARPIAGMMNSNSLAANQSINDARTAMRLGDFAAALRHAQRALSLDPSNPQAHALVAEIYARLKNFDQSLSAANRGLAASPRSTDLLNAKAFAQNRTGRWRDALASSNEAIEIDPKNAYAYANRAHAYGGLNDRDAMMSDIERAARLDGAFGKAAAGAAALQLPSKDDVLFLFPGEEGAASAAAPAAKRSRNSALVVAAGVVGGLLMALGLLSTVLAPVKDSVVSAFTRATRRGPTLGASVSEPEETVPVAASPSGVIRGQYEILRQIGQGGMGMVYEGTDRSLGRRVAIKKMRDELRVNQRERERFVIEAKTVASLHHPNIVDIYAIAEEGDDVFLVFEYVDGRTIHDILQSQGRLNPSDAVRITQAMSEALTYAHTRGVIHRDMKPSNVMLAGAQIKVMDFGIARMAKDAMTRYSMTNTVVGTPPYMAPEQEQGVVRKESDVYSLAICAYEMLTGKLPFIGMGAGMLMNKINMSFIPPARAIAGLPPVLDEVFAKAFQADPENRYRTPQEFAVALSAAFGGTRSRKVA